MIHLYTTIILIFLILFFTFVPYYIGKKANKTNYSRDFTKCDYWKAGFVDLGKGLLLIILFVALYGLIYSLIYLID